MDEIVIRKLMYIIRNLFVYSCFELYACNLKLNKFNFFYAKTTI